MSEQKMTVREMRDYINQLQHGMFALMGVVDHLTIILGEVVTRHDWEDDMKQLVEDHREEAKQAAKEAMNE